VDTIPWEDGQISTILDDAGNPWFVAKDVCRALEFRDTNDGTKYLDNDEKQVVKINPINGRGNPNTVIINESGLYSLILRSRKPQAKAFKKWVTSEVLPSIRKTGQYVHNQVPANREEEFRILNIIADGLKMCNSCRLGLYQKLANKTAPAIAQVLREYTIDAQ
jgi:prophage antirepressor-like protein